MKPYVDQGRCIGCGACVKVCPITPKVVELKDVKDGKRAVIVHPELCDLGRACERACPTKAFKFVRD
ncbi:MAG: 4Fe-4S binding protein [Candidatus Altiarchaeota archaeon]